MKPLMLLLAFVLPLFGFDVRKEPDITKRYVVEGIVTGVMPDGLIVVCEPSPSIGRKRAVGVVKVRGYPGAATDGHKIKIEALLNGTELVEGRTVPLFLFHKMR